MHNILYHIMKNTALTLIILSLLVSGERRPEWLAFMKKNYPPGFQYQDFAPHFKAEMFDVDKWVDILKASGAK